MFDSDVIRQGIKNKSILNVMRDIDRRNFVSKEYSDIAYDDCAIPLGENQTISQPFIVAFMTENLELKPRHKVLEIGTGSGFQTAVLSKLADLVVSVEINEVLAKKASIRLNQLGYSNISLHHSDGIQGISKYAPYDRILVSAASDKIPKKLFDQLSINGQMIIPIGKQSEVQHLWLIKKMKDGEIKKEKILPVHFASIIKG
ncbi:protein-L-isoaspartate(D-aspartate) O-methyltransferase [bacterium]|jgi:protein-L-isoaspartate(D-aspartate) O-methyltransferase|nr:protein-L-isoaspartate(D-aspartate) O-methyltransferase [bacterium]MBT4250199.1 protein-L-isoaspartate(D-aspartate) O-methyltransferase [bacterium]MBT4927474.1 protein-L-isoaspartate(D-aspartate) O-methyltransferase [bacterium]MBT5734678.1 protein-L-isoaspartate(D-aspartate) O-methyltransferase [bacterium]MBT6019160.1 protein-L-isoaspartate(D-aspartate) O-methyltransferase [bacterium]